MDFLSSTPADPNLAEVYERSKSIANKFLNSDDEVKTYAEISVEIFEVVDVLPEIGEKNKIYLVPSENGMFDEYFYNPNEKWDKIGKDSSDAHRILVSLNSNDSERAFMGATLNTSF